MPKIVSVHSFRHGTGKSNLTANLAVSIARQGQHVGIIDTDIQPPGIHTLFGVDDAKTDPILNYYLWGDVSPQHAILNPNPNVKIDQGEITVMGRGVSLTPSNIRVGEIPQLLRQGYDMNTLSQGFLELSRRLDLDCLLIDSHPGLTEETLLSIAISDVLVLILRLDSQNFQGVAVTIDVARKLGVPKILLVANQVPSNFRSEDVKQQLEHTYGEPVAGVLPFADEMIELASTGVFSLHYPNHPLTHEMQAIAQKIFHPSSSESAIYSSPVTAASYPAPELELTMFDVLTLPDPQRQMMSWIMRQGTVTLEQVATYVAQDEIIVCAVLKTLIEQGFIQELTIEGRLQYRPHMVVKRNRQPPKNVWQLLEDNSAE